LGNIKAEFGNVYEIMHNRLTGKSKSGTMLPEDELPEDFEKIDLRANGGGTGSGDYNVDLIRAMPGYERTTELVSAYAQAADDAADMGATMAVAAQRPLFQKLSSIHLQSALPDTTLKVAPPCSRDTGVENISQKLDGVRTARQKMMCTIMEAHDNKQSNSPIPI
jgi:hypothetical protein